MLVSTLPRASLKGVSKLEVDACSNVDCCRDCEVTLGAMREVEGAAEMRLDFVAVGRVWRVQVRRAELAAEVGGRIAAIADEESGDVAAVEASEFGRRCFDHCKSQPPSQCEQKIRSSSLAERFQPRSTFSRTELLVPLAALLFKQCFSNSSEFRTIQRGKRYQCRYRLEFSEFIHGLWRQLLIETIQQYPP